MKRFDAAAARLRNGASIAVGDRIEVICDGGIRRGSHVLKALSVGARACSGGRAYLYALAAAGQPGVERALTLLREEIERDMKLMGCRSLAELGRPLGGEYLRMVSQGLIPANESLYDPAALRAATRDVALDFLACGLDPDRAAFYRQHDVPEVTELAWFLSTLAPMGLLERCHSYKDKLAEAQSSTGRKDAIVIGRGRIRSRPRPPAPDRGI